MTTDATPFGALIGHLIVTGHDTDVGFLCPLLFLSS